MPAWPHGAGGDATQISQLLSDDHRLIMIGRLAVCTRDSMAWLRQCGGQVLLDRTIIVGSGRTNAIERAGPRLDHARYARLHQFLPTQASSPAGLSTLLASNLRDSIPIARTIRVA